jgi:hypothetical protein
MRSSATEQPPRGEIAVHATGIRTGASSVFLNSAKRIARSPLIAKVSCRVFVESGRRARLATSRVGGD